MKSSGLAAQARAKTKRKLRFATQAYLEFLDLGGATEVVLTHEFFPDADLAGKHNEGWTSCLNRLESLFKA